MTDRIEPHWSRESVLQLIRWYGSEYDSLVRMPYAELEEFRRHAMQQIFNELVVSCDALGRMASRRKIQELRTREDLLQVLFPHTAYKSYPDRWVDQGNFEALTGWLSSFTTHDLSRAEVRDVRSVDDWIVALDEATEVRLAHTFGTSGKLSFVPRSREEWARGGATLRLLYRDFDTHGMGPDLYPGDLPLIAPTYRYGANASARALDGVVEAVAGGEQNALFLYPAERFSADVASLGGQLKRLEGTAVRGELSVPERVLNRRDELERMHRERPGRLEQFFIEAERRFRGRDVYMFMLWPTAIEWAEEGLSRGITHLFGPGSIFVTGGGLKGKNYKPGWRERVFEFLGINRCYELYGMTEANPQNMRCEAGNYHSHPLLVPFVLDPIKGHELPRTGLQTGRYAALDLNATSMWGGFVSGDQVTMGGWDAPCKCGRQGIYVKPEIVRYSELQGGSDKISCAGAPEAHDHAIEYLVDGISS